MKNRLHAWLLPLAAWLLAAVVSSQLHPREYAEGRSRDPLRQVRANQSALARILGEFRTATSDMLFIKTERYLHSGVGYVPHLTEKILTVEGTDAQVQDHLAEMKEGDGHHDHDHFHHDEEVATLVPTQTRDYRGWIGDMHRTVKPWRDPALAHRHTDGKELIPWFRMMTLSDPGYIRGYIVGAFWIKHHDPHAALTFIEEGILHNPGDFQLYVSKGFLLTQLARREEAGGVLSGESPEQRVLLRAAGESFQTAAELMLNVRPPESPDQDIVDHPRWGNYLESDARSAAYMSVLFEVRYGDPAAAETLRKRYAKVFPDHARLQVPLD